ncbi:hypothetical protein SAMN05216293_2570 [Flagellimonas taeanensis]|uniref:Uncharacterized protein n=1 Tax=Flagellimonas taeanensis TaxID=1005926 RepID=A0A1M6XGJ6_9FLAO|nr:hypothetical protein SAMN05216293_2570 [Allomuricauda taeanensis]
MVDVRKLLLQDFLDHLYLFQGNIGIQKLVGLHLSLHNFFHKLIYSDKGWIF